MMTDQRIQLGAVGKVMIFWRMGKKSIETGCFSLYSVINAVEWRNSPLYYEEADDKSELTAGTF